MAAIDEDDEERAANGRGGTAPARLYREGTRMKGKGMDRRQFLQSSGLTIAGAAAAGGIAMIVDPKGAWALTLAALDRHTAETLVAVCREMYPHDAIGDIYYARVVETLDQKAAGDSELAKTLKNGVAALDRTYGIAFLDLSEGHRLKALKSMENTGFFQTVRGTTVTTLYNDEQVWRFFGYEGSAFEYGGYIDRGFNDLGWLPDIS